MASGDREHGGQPWHGGGPIEQDSNRSVFQNGVRVLTSIYNLLLNSYLFGEATVTVGVSTVAGLPAASSVAQGTRRTVTDANATTFASVVAGGGSNIVPVYSDSTNWRIG